MHIPQHLDIPIAERLVLALPLTCKVVFALHLVILLLFNQMERMEISGSLGFQGVVFICLFVFLCGYINENASSGKSFSIWELPCAFMSLVSMEESTIRPEETIGVSPALEQAAFPGARAYLCPRSFLPFPRNGRNPCWPPVECCFRSNLTSLMRTFFPFELSEHFLGSLRIELLHYLLTSWRTGGLLA